MCTNCCTTTPGFGCNWMNNYTQCGPCHSNIYCPACKMAYRDGEMVIQCVQCDRWLHGMCDGLCNEDDLERAADYGYHCLYCRPRTGQKGPCECSVFKTTRKNTICLKKKKYKSRSVLNLHCQTNSF